jgi:hypothetical protein
MHASLPASSRVENIYPIIIEREGREEVKMTSILKPPSFPWSDNKEASFVVK